MSASLPRDFIERLELAQRTVAPGPKAALIAEARGYVDLGKGGVHLVAVSATGIPEAIREAMWWKPSVIREGESYASFHARAEKRRRLAQEMRDA